MDIDYIQMKNYRQYADARIEFARAPSRNFTIIQGANGAGKTNLVNAITWCLFGDETHIDSKYAGLPILNTTVLDESGDELIEVKVEIQFVQSDDSKMVVTRSSHFKKGKDGNLKEMPSPHSLSVMQMKGRDWLEPIYGDDAQYIINNRVPPTIEEYFFFDGERMDDYFKENTGKDIKSAVFEISQLELFERMIEHLTIRRNDFLKTSRGLSSRATELTEFLQLHSRSLETDKVVLDELLQKKSEAEKLEREFSEKLKNSSLERIQQLEETRDELKEDVRRLDDEIKEFEENRLKLLHQYMPVLLSYDALLRTRNLIEGRREAGLIPPLFQTIFIESLLKKGRCICGSDISEKDEYSSGRRKKVKSFLEGSQLSEKSNELIESNTLIRRMMESIEGFPEQVIDLNRKLKDAQESKEDKEQKSKVIEQEIKQSNVENIKLWEKEREKYSSEKEQLVGDIAKQRSQIEKRQKIVNACKSELNQELQKEKKHKYLLDTLAFCDEGIESAQEVRDTIMKKVKIEIEKKTSEQFLALIWKKDTYNGVCIDDDYNISVPHVSGREALGTLSAGERQVCALSFMAALNSVSGFEVPLVIDTPLARISSEPSRSIARNLPNYLQNKQVTLLVTEKEYTPEVKKELAHRVGKTYVINVTEKERGNLAEVKSIQ
jgi:DNA sulfur modification protein DndD